MLQASFIMTTILAQSRSPLRTAAGPDKAALRPVTLPAQPVTPASFLLKARKLPSVTARAEQVSAACLHAAYADCSVGIDIELSHVHEHRRYLNGSTAYAFPKTQSCSSNKPQEHVHGLKWSSVCRAQARRTSAPQRYSEKRKPLKASHLTSRRT